MEGKRVQGSGLSVKSLGFRVQGFGYWLCVDCGKALQANKRGVLMTCPLDWKSQLSITHPIPCQLSFLFHQLAYN